MSFAQFNTDLIVADMFPEDYIIRYLDVGCGGAVSGSNTYLFYLRGGSGITIDPIVSHIEEHKRERPRDTQVWGCAGNFDGEIVFYECDEKTISTTSYTEAEKRKSSGQKIKLYKVPIFKLDTILEDVDNKSFDIVSIDTEGNEKDVLLGYTDLAAKIVIIEGCWPCTETPSYHEWEYLLIEKSYTYICSAGVNRIYKKGD